MRDNFKLIYASDLDRTLIYSQAFIDMHPVADDLILVDESKMNSYMAKSVAVKLTEVVNNPDVEFIPVTTRSIAEYKRIKFPFTTPEYAVVASGGVILHNGEIFEEYREYLNRLAKNIFGDYNFESEFNNIIDDINSFDEVEYSSKIVDNTFVFSKTTDLKKTRANLAKLGEKYKYFRFLLDKHKIYAIPNHITKETALNWIKLSSKVHWAITSGDSAFDIPLLRAGSIKVVPTHAYLTDDEIKELDVVRVEGEVLSPLNTFNIINDTLNKITT